MPTAISTLLPFGLGLTVSTALILLGGVALMSAALHASRRTALAGVGAAALLASMASAPAARPPGPRAAMDCGRAPTLAERADLRARDADLVHRIEALSGAVARLELIAQSESGDDAASLREVVTLHLRALNRAHAARAALLDRY